MAHKKSGGSSKNGRDSNSKRLGIKKFGGENVIAGNIILRQKGNKWWAGAGTDTGKDFTIYALNNGVVKFYEKKRKRYDGKIFKDIFVSVV